MTAYPIEVYRYGQWVPGRIVGGEVEDGRKLIDVELAYADYGGATRVWAFSGSVNVRMNSRQGEGPGT
jgi:hypothetical protein